MVRVDSLASRERLREALPLLPRAQIADHPPGILKAADQPVDRALPAECHDVRARLADPQTLPRPGHTRHGCVPLLAHEAAALAPALDVVPGAAPPVRAQAVGWIGDYGVDAVVRQSAQQVEAIALLDVPGPHRFTSLTSIVLNSITLPQPGHLRRSWAGLSLIVRWHFSQRPSRSLIW